MLTRLFAAALFAGLAAGLIVAGLQSYFVTPMILKAEVYEAKEAQAAHEHADKAAKAEAGHSHGAEEWQPADGFERFGYAALATVATAIGYALILAALMTIAGASLDTETHLKWALGAFIATALAPGIGLAPTLPGIGENALEPRQIWWIATALATGTGLYVLTHHTRSALAVLGGLALIAIPHIWGAPIADFTSSELPPRLAAQFASSSIALTFILWMVIGLGLSAAFARLGNTSPQVRPA